MERNAMEQLQHEIGAWQRKTFKSATVKSTFAHLAREIIELSKAIRDGSYNEVSGEIADCFHLLFGLAEHYDLNAYIAVKHKFEVNKKRKWKQPDESGVCEHIK